MAQGKWQDPEQMVRRDAIGTVQSGQRASGLGRDDLTTLSDGVEAPGRLGTLPQDPVGHVDVREP
jgi:hypothetical protein